MADTAATHQPRAPCSPLSAVDKSGPLFAVVSLSGQTAKKNMPFVSKAELTKYSLHVES
ncbi:MAG: hypothetical protein ACJAXW_003275 [Candidatus Azotimanducaceae bacterium]|jgi:hypothetical protein